MSRPYGPGSWLPLNILKCINIKRKLAAAEEKKMRLLYSLQIDFLSHGSGSLAGETETRVPDQSR